MAELPIRMLLVEDSQHDAEFITMMLQRSQEIVAQVDHVRSLREAIDALHRCKYDIVLLDLGLPDSSGTDSVSRLRDCAPDTPVVVLTGDDRNDTAMSAINSGAQDFLPKQHLVGQLLTRMTKHSIARHHQLAQAQADALVDGLTGIPNRRSHDIETDRQLSDFRCHGNPFCVAVFDIDHFKRINDRWGHDAGDQAIKAVANALAISARDSDHVCRYGGEEFALTMPRTEITEAQIGVLRCHRAVSPLVVGEQEITLTVSVGLAEITDQEDGRTLLARADEALYGAKCAGRNRCMLHYEGEVIDGSRQIQGAQALTGKR
jgi:two-component system cell cycle response regulator